MRAEISRSSPTRSQSSVSARRRRRSCSTPSPSSGSRAARPPSTIGARNSRISSISPASRNAPARCGPPSSRIEPTPRGAELIERRAHAGGLVLAGGDDHLGAVGLERVGGGARRGAGDDDRERDPSARRGRAWSRAAAGRASRTRSGAAGAATPSTRAVSCGSSASAVPMPTATASHSARQWCARGAALLAGDPLRVAAARGDLAVERHRRLEQHPRPPGAGVLAERLVEQPGARRRARRRRRTTSMPSSRRMPEAAPGGVLGRVVGGDDDAARSRPRRIASVHGGVVPWWQHGSSETYSVAPVEVARRRRRGSPRPRRGARRARGGSPRR